MKRAATSAMLAMTSFLLMASFASALETLEDDIHYDNEDDAALSEASPRFLYFNSSSTATALTLLGALILLGVIFYLVYVGGLLAPSVSSSNNYAYNRNDYYNQHYNQDQFRARYTQLTLFVHHAL
jgi:hypothetical protein